MYDGLNKTSKGIQKIPQTDYRAMLFIKKPGGEIYKCTALVGNRGNGYKYNKGKNSPGSRRVKPKVVKQLFLTTE